jgi:hypothetical protein
VKQAKAETSKANDMLAKNIANQAAREKPKPFQQITSLSHMAARKALSLLSLL